MGSRTRMDPHPAQNTSRVVGNDRRMDRSTALVLAGVVLLVAAAAVPLAWLVSSEWDTDYVYTVDERDTYCTGVVHETPSVEGTEDFRVVYENLSSTGREQFDRALADDRYVVENKTAAASDFQFTSDHVAAGEGCYAVAHDGDTYALRTSTESRRLAPLGIERPLLVAGLIGVLGVASLLGGVVLLVRGRLD